jgi:hypothetical protein
MQQEEQITGLYCPCSFLRQFHKKRCPFIIGFVCFNYYYYYYHYHYCKCISVVYKHYSYSHTFSTFAWSATNSLVRINEPEKMSPYNSILRICLLANNIQIDGRCVCCKYAMFWTDFLNVSKYWLLQRNLLDNSLQEEKNCHNNLRTKHLIWTWTRELCIPK